MRFCTSCQSYKHEEGGEFRKMPKAGRWLCADCSNRRSESIYKSRYTTTPAHLKRLRMALEGRGGK